MKDSLRGYLWSALFGAIGGLLTIGVIILLDLLIDVVWAQGFGMDVDAPTRTLAIPLVLLAASLPVILLNRRGDKLKGMTELMDEVISTGTMNWRLLPRALATALISIASGASLGPEAPSAVVAGSAAAYTAEKTKTSSDVARTMGIGGLSGMLGSLLSTPFLSISMMLESTGAKIKQLPSFITNTMIASAVGAATFFAIYGKVYVINIGLPPYNGSNLESLGLAFLLGIAGALMGIVAFVITNRLLLPLKRQFGLPRWADILLTALLVGGLAYWLPITMFSGQHTAPTLMAQAASWSVGMLLVIGLVKLVSTSLLLDGYFFGGPIFPALFAGMAFGLAFNRWFEVSPSLAIPATVAGLLTVSLRRPLSAALLTVAITGFATSTEVALGVAGAMLVVVAITHKINSKEASRG